MDERTEKNVCTFASIHQQQRTYTHTHANDERITPTPDAVDESSRAETSVGIPSYKTHMKLTIFSVTADDFGVVKCVAKNPRGETDGTIRLYSKFKHFHFIIMYSHV